MLQTVYKKPLAEKFSKKASYTFEHTLRQFHYSIMHM